MGESSDRREFVIGALLDEVELAGARTGTQGPTGNRWPSQVRPCARCTRDLWLPPEIQPDWVPVCARCGRYIVEEAEREAMEAAARKGAGT